jgi:hypothetical protein
VADRIVGILELAGELAGQIHLPRPGRPLVDLLEKDDIGVVVGEDVDDSIRPEAPIDTDGPMDVVGQTGEFQNSDLSTGQL